MNIATQSRSYNAKQLDASKRKQLALAAMAKSQPLTEMAEENKVSRKFIYQQRGKAMEAVNDAFTSAEHPQRKSYFICLSRSVGCASSFYAWCCIVVPVIAVFKKHFLMYSIIQFPLALFMR